MFGGSWNELDVPVGAGEPLGVSGDSGSSSIIRAAYNVVEAKPDRAAYTQLFDLPLVTKGVGFVRDLTRDGDVESNPGPDLWCGQISENTWGTRIMSLHEDFDVVDRWVWELAFVSNQRVISLPRTTVVSVAVGPGLYVGYLAVDVQLYPLWVGV